MGKETIKGYFETGDTPSQSEFEELVDAAFENSNYKKIFLDVSEDLLDSEKNALQSIIDIKFWASTGDEYRLTYLRKSDGLLQIRNWDLWSGDPQVSANWGINLDPNGGHQTGFYYLKDWDAYLYLSIDMDVLTQDYTNTGIGSNSFKFRYTNKEWFFQNELYNDLIQRKAVVLNPTYYSTIEDYHLTGIDGIIKCEFNVVPGKEDHYFFVPYLRKSDGFFQIRDKTDYDNGLTTNVGYTFPETTGIQSALLQARGIGLIYVEVDFDKITTDLGFQTSAVQLIPRDGLNQKFNFSTLRRKKILWLGTSIPEGGRYAEWLASVFCFELINNSKGSSRVSKLTGSYVGRDWRTHTRVLWDTIVEKQYIIDNWATISPDLTGPDKPSTLSQSDIDYILSTSYENALIPHLDADLIVFDHGYNEKSAAMTSVDIDSRDNTTFIGAINSFFDLIFEDDIYTRIAICGHYENVLFPYLNECQESIASNWNIEIFKLWEKVGWSQQMINGDTVLNNWLPDGVHPNGNTQAGRRIRDALYGYFKSMNFD